MDQADYIIEKLGFLALTPFDVKSKEELESVRGYSREQGNRIVGGLVGSLVGGVGGTLAGATTSIITGTRRPGAAVALGGLGALAGGITGGIRSLRKTEREAGAKPSGFGKIIGRKAGAFLMPVPFLGDYVVSRHLTDYKPSGALQTNE